MAVDRNDPDRKLFAEELRAMREDRHWSRDELGKLINFSASTINNIESMFRAPTHQQALLLDKAFGTPGTFARLEARLRGVPFSAGFRPFYPYEREAGTLRTFEHTLVPGLFQTEDYTRTLAEAYPGVSQQDVQERVGARMARQTILDRKEPAPPWMWVVLDEHVLHQEIGGRQVMWNQLAHLLGFRHRRWVKVQVLPFAAGAHAGLLGSFVLLRFDDNPDIAYEEDYGPGRMTANSPEVRERWLRYDHLQAAALSVEDSAELIARVMEERYGAHP